MRNSSDTHNLTIFVTCVQTWEWWGHGSLPKSGEEELVGLLTLDTSLVTQPLLQAWRTNGVKTPIVFGMSSDLSSVYIYVL